MIRELQKAWLEFKFRPPADLRCGPHTTVGRPRRINGAEFVSVGSRVRIGGNPMIAAIGEYAGERFRPEVIVGDDVYIGPNLYLVCVSQVVLGKGCVLSENVFLSDVSHGMSPTDGLIMEQKLIPGGAIEIGDHSFVGFRASIMSGVRLGHHCIVGANSVVTMSFPEYSLVVGNPARLVKRYSLETQRWERVGGGSG